jgi:hypothetical protein
VNCEAHAFFRSIKLCGGFYSLYAPHTSTDSIPLS